MTDFSSGLEKTSRRVRFSLPEAKLIFPNNRRNLGLSDNSKLGNDALIAIISPQNSKGADFSIKSVTTYRTNVRPSVESKSFANQCFESCDMKLKSTNLYSGYRRNVKSPTRQSFSGLPTIERKASSLDDSNSAQIDKECFSTSNLTKYKSSDDLRDPTTYKIKNIIKLPETSEGSTASMKNLTSNFLKVPEYNSESYQNYF